METYYSQLLPALFDEKDLCFVDWVDDFFNGFGALCCTNAYGTTSIGFIDDGKIEARVHCVANRLTVELLQCAQPPQKLIDKIVRFFSINGDDENMPYVCHYWFESPTVINFQYYNKPD